MASFDPLSALIGGLLIGLASALLMLLIGRIAGISGILDGALMVGGVERHWRLAFVAGLIAAPLISGVAGYPLAVPQMTGNPLLIVIAGLLVGFGTRLGNGCTSGHGVCGIARRSLRSVTATIIFVVTAMVVVVVSRHGIGG